MDIITPPLTLIPWLTATTTPIPPLILTILPQSLILLLLLLLNPTLTTLTQEVPSMPSLNVKPRLGQTRILVLRLLWSSLQILRLWRLLWRLLRISLRQILVEINENFNSINVILIIVIQQLLVKETSTANK